MWHLNHEVLNCIFNGALVLTTGIIGWFTYKISAEQLRITRHKKDDFLYNKRFDIYKEVRNTMFEANSELWALNNKEIKCINAQFVRPLYNKFSLLMGDAELLFDDKDILDFMHGIQYDLSQLFGINNVNPGNDDEKSKILNKWNEYITSEYVSKLFQPYLKLV